MIILFQVRIFVAAAALLCTALRINSTLAAVGQALMMKFPELSSTNQTKMVTAPRYSVQLVAPIWDMFLKGKDLHRATHGIA